MDWTRTTTKLIDDLRDNVNAAAWAEFDSRYRALIVGFARHMGHGADDAAEVAQRTLAKFAEGHRQGAYRRERGRLRSWLIGIARHIAADVRRERGRGGVGDHPSFFTEGTSDQESDLTTAWQREQERVVLARALEMLRSSSRTDAHTLHAFELFALRGVPAERVAELCGISIDSVYVAKNRLTKRLREIVREMTQAYEEDQ